MRIKTALLLMFAVTAVAPACPKPPPQPNGPLPDAGGRPPDAGVIEIGELEVGDSADARYGAHIGEGGWVHFGVYAPAATAVHLLLFDAPQALIPGQVVPMFAHGTDWRVRVRGPGVEHGLLYMYRADGANELSEDDQHGPTFNPHYLVSDPYAYNTQNVAFSTVFSSTPFADVEAPLYAGGGKSVVYDHGRDPTPDHVLVAREDLIVYELHVQDYTARLQSLDPTLRGTYLGLAETGLTTPGGLSAGIDHLVELGINAVELMPVMEYDEETGNAPGRYNHWGYMTTNFFAPEARYAATPGAQVVELKALIQAFHDRGIAVFLDVVYNHTAEQSPWLEDGRLARKCYNFMCLAPTEVYRADSEGRFFFNNTGTGNDVSFLGGDERFTKRMVRDSLSLWHQAYGADGFRFDLARILSDGSDSAADWVDEDPRFATAHLHAEPWDLGGVWWEFMDSGPWDHSNNRWAKWLGRYRDQMRGFSRSSLRDPAAFKRLIEGHGAGDNGPASTKPWRSVNFVAIHDGYTLRDCTFFDDDDGAHQCWSSDGDENLRRERHKLLLGLLLTSRGVPILLQGDEFGRTKSGALSQADAHNTYNYESMTGDPAVDHVSWIDWGLKDNNPAGSPNGPAYGGELFRWTRDLIRLRKAWTHFRRPEFALYEPTAASGDGNDGRFTYIWDDPAGGDPIQLAVVWWGRAGEPDLMVIYNEHWEPFTVSNLGDWSRGDWRILARSWFGDDADTCPLQAWESECPTAGAAIEVKGRSMAILISDND
ncbi:alpha-amylase family glycosyl hydrolase [Haliangium sp.]|uniref:alpha-amylase family glycosyl hydrolase n=1 Tax=Haliangium sp. TaxID=2663208 RepID=UPI003D0D3CB2